MVRNSKLQCFVAAMLVAFLCLGCQTTDNKWVSAWKERTKPKPKFQGLDDTEEVTYWPYKPDKSRSKKMEQPGQLKEKLAKKTEQVKRDEQFKDLITQGDQFRKNGQLDDARIAYTQALATSPDSPEVHHRLAIIADKQKRYAAADQHYQAALHVQPRNINLLSDLGYSFYLRGNLEQAESTLKQALEIDRSHQGAMANLGAVYAQQIRRDDALAMFRAGASEADAQRYYANLFPQDGVTPVAASSASPAQQQQLSRSTPPGSAKIPESELRKMSQEQIQDLMAKLGQEAKRQRYEADQRELARSRELSAGNNLDAMQQTARSAEMPQPGGRQPLTAPPMANSQGVDGWAQPNPAGNNPDAAAIGLPQRSQAQAMSAPGSPFEVVRGNNRPQPTGGQYPAGNNVPPTGPATSAAAVASNPNEVAAQLGMGMGPGSLFPIVQSPQVAAAPAAATINLSAVENLQPSGYRSPQTLPDNRIEQASGSMPANASNIDGVPSIAPVSPASDWGSPAWGNQNWQSDSSGAAGTGIDSGAGQLMRSQNTIQNSMPNDSLAPNGTQIRPGTAPVRPYNGTWPNANSLPGGPGEGSGQYSANYGSNDGPTATNGMNTAPAQYGAPANANSNAPPMWKYAPAR